MVLVASLHVLASRSRARGPLRVGDCLSSDASCPFSGSRTARYDGCPLRQDALVEIHAPHVVPVAGCHILDTQREIVAIAWPGHRH